VNVEILPQAKSDLFDGFCFYEDQKPGLGDRFYAVLSAAIESLHQQGGVHRKLGRHHRLLAPIFPHAVYYRVEHNKCFVDAVVDCRRDPEWIREHVRP
jgi:hypothetical protein